MRIILQLVLRVLAGLLRFRAATSTRFRAQITRSVNIGISTVDGVARQYRFADRGVSSSSADVPQADAGLEFASAGLALRCLLSRNGTAHIFRGLQNQTIRLRGDGLLIIWFQGMANQALPLTPIPRLAARPPDAYLRPSDQLVAADRIVREPVADILDPQWEGAAEARAKTLMLEAAAGKPLPPF